MSVLAVLPVLGVLESCPPFACPSKYSIMRQPFRNQPAPYRGLSGPLGPKCRSLENVSRRTNSKKVSGTIFRHSGPEGPRDLCKGRAGCQMVAFRVHAKKHLLLENLLRTLLRSVRLHDPLGVHPSLGGFDGFGGFGGHGGHLGAKKTHKDETHKQNFHGIVPRFLGGFCLCVFCSPHNRLLPPTQSRDNPANLFMFMCFFPESCQTVSNATLADATLVF